MLGGEAFLQRIYDAYRSMTSPSGTNVWNTALLIGWDEPGGTYDHVAPGPVPPPGCWGTDGRTRLRLRPLRLPSPSHHGVSLGCAGLGVQRGAPPHLPHRHATEGVGPRGCIHANVTPSARTFDQVFALDEPRRPEDWVTVEAQPVPVVDAGRRRRRRGTEHARQGHRPRPHRRRQENGGAVAGRTRWTGRRVHPRAPHQVPAADLLASFPPVGAEQPDCLKPLQSSGWPELPAVM